MYIVKYIFIELNEEYRVFVEFNNKEQAEKFAWRQSQLQKMKEVVIYKSEIIEHYTEQ